MENEAHQSRGSQGIYVLLCPASQTPGKGEPDAKYLENPRCSRQAALQPREVTSFLGDADCDWGFKG